jgi:hypothetical protein
VNRRGIRMEFAAVDAGFELAMLSDAGGGLPTNEDCFGHAVHFGNSRLYLVRGDFVSQLTKDL